ncbi:MAG: hypothetical protein ACE5D4_07085 [Thermodesulfobacteriota bacterium]
MDLKSQIEKAIVKTCIQIIKEPLIYFSEADVQQLLAENLRATPVLQRLYPTSVKKGKNSKARFTTSLIHREYGGGSGRRIDIVIFREEDVKDINDVNLTCNKKYLTPEYAFELGTEKTTDTENHLKKDLHKLGNVKNTGYLIHFYKDTTQARTGTLSRGNTEQKIQRTFKSAFEDKREQGDSKVKVLSILLRAYRDQVRMRGKCEIFNGEKWVKRNINKDAELRSAILSQLR